MNSIHLGCRGFVIFCLAMAFIHIKLSSLHAQPNSTTPPNFKIAFIGDQGLGINSEAVLNLIKNEGAHAVVLAGDLDYEDNPLAWDDQLNRILGADFPCFTLIGNHDKSAFYGPGGYQSFITARMNRLGIPWQGNLGVQSHFTYQGILFVMTAPGVDGAGHETYIRDVLAADTSIWSISSWHKNMNLMQVGDKPDDTGWEVYEESRKGGAIIVTAHEHSYSRTHLLSNFQNQTVADSSNTLTLINDEAATTVDEGTSFAFVSGLGGKSVRSQALSGNWWASIYTSTQGASHGALFGTFNAGGVANRAEFYFKDINGVKPDSFVVISNVSTAPPAQYSLTTNAVGSGSVSINPSGGLYNSGTPVTLTATPEAGYQFSGWSGDLSGSLNPAVLTMNANKTIIATFTPLPPQYTLTVNTVGSGNVALNPAGNVYNDGTTVTLTATPMAGYQFNGWSGDLSGSTNPVTLTMNANKIVVATFAIMDLGGQVLHQQTVTGSSSSSTTVTTSASLAAMNGELYLAAISMDAKVAVAAVSGLGLNWTLVKSQCSGKNKTAIEVWMAQGVPSSSGTVTATFVSKPSNAVIAVSRYANVDVVVPIGNMVSGNTVGWNGVCSGGVDSKAYSFNLNTTLNGSIVYGAAAMRDRSHTPAAGYTERADIKNSKAAVAVEEKTVPAVAAISIDGTFSGSVDWAVIGLEIRPQSGSGTLYTLATNVVGSGNVTPTGGSYSPGAMATLTATPAAGYQFAGWSGDLSGTKNPATISMDANKTAVATFTQLPPQYTLSINTVGSGSIVLNPSNGVYDSGTPVTLTATPGAGYQFTGWSGDLSGTTNPASITMDANKNVTANFTIIDLSWQVAHQQTVTGSSSGSTTVKTSASLAAVNGELYLAAIAMDSKVAVSAVSGLDLNWTPVKVQCSGKNKTAIEVWMAQGTPGSSDMVTATFVSKPSNAVIAVSRYANVDATAPIGNMVSSNTMGVNGACAGGTDGKTYSLNLNTSLNGAMVYGAAAMRDRSHTPGAGYAERADIKKSKAAAAVEDKMMATAGATTLDGAFSGSVDWAVIGLEIRPQGSGAPSQHRSAANAGSPPPAMSKSPAATAKENLPPAEFALEANYPNPFWSPAASRFAGNPGTVINFSLPQTANVRLKIYDVTGQLVRVLVAGEMAAGRHAEHWDGRDNFNRAVAAGAYLYQISIETEDRRVLFMQTRRMTLLK